MKKLLFLALLVAFALPIAGCGGGGRSDQDRIRSLYSSLASAIHNERVDEVMLLFDPDYLDDGYTYTDVRNGTAQLFDQYNDIRDTYSLYDIRVYGDQAQVSGHLRETAIDTFNGNQAVARERDFTDYLIYYRGDWYFYGNHHSATAARQSLRFSPKFLQGK